MQLGRKYSLAGTFRTGTEDAFAARVLSQCELAGYLERGEAGISQRAKRGWSCTARDSPAQGDTLSRVNGMDPSLLFFLYCTSTVPRHGDDPK